LGLRDAERNIPVQRYCNFVYAIITKNATKKQIDDLDVELESLDKSKMVNRIRLPSIQEGESVHKYRQRNAHLIKDRADAMREMEEDIFGDLYDLVQNPVVEEG